MAKNKIKRETGTIGFRLDKETIKSISDDAKALDMTIQDYFLSQIPPTSRLGKILQEEQLKMMKRTELLANVQKEMAESALRIQQEAGITEDEFINAATRVFTSLIKGEGLPEK